MRRFQFDLEVSKDQLSEASQIPRQSLSTDHNCANQRGPEFEMFLDRSAHYKNGTISANEYFKDLDRWFPLFKQFSVVTMELNLECQLQVSTERLYSIAPLKRLVDCPIRKRRLMLSRTGTKPGLESRIIARSLAQNLTMEQIECSSSLPARAPKISGKVGRIKSYWKKIDSVFPYIFDRKYFFQTINGTKRFEIDYIDLSTQNITELSSSK